MSDGESVVVDDSAEPPPGAIRYVITYLELPGRPKRPLKPAPPLKLALMRAEEPPVSFYRYLYHAVGAPWLWTDRKKLDDARIAEILRDPRTELTVLYVAGVPAGFAELFRETPDTTDLAYFGIMPEFIGRKLGPFLLDAAIDLAFAQPIERMTVNTCTLDHPRALATYQRAGFVPYRREIVTKPDPRLTGDSPPNAAPHVPLARA